MVFSARFWSTAAASAPADTAGSPPRPPATVRGGGGGRWRGCKRGGAGAAAGVTANAIDVEQFMDQTQWSGEFQVSGTVLRDATPWLKGLSYTAGAFYFTESGEDGSALPIPFATQLTAGRYINNMARNASTAG